MQQPPLQKSDSDNHPSQRLWWRLSLLLPFLLVVLWRPTSDLNSLLVLLTKQKGDRFWDGMMAREPILRHQALAPLSQFLRRNGWNDSWLWTAESRPFFPTLEALLHSQAFRLKQLTMFESTHGQRRQNQVDVRFIQQNCGRGSATLHTDGKHRYVIVALEKPGTMTICESSLEQYVLLLFDSRGLCQDVCIVNNPILGWFELEQPGQWQLAVVRTFPADEQPGFFTASHLMAQVPCRYLRRGPWNDLHFFSNRLVVRNGRFVDLYAK